MDAHVPQCPGVGGLIEINHQGHEAHDELFGEQLDRAASISITMTLDK